MKQSTGQTVIGVSWLLLLAASIGAMFHVKLNGGFGELWDDAWKWFATHVSAITGVVTGGFFATIRAEDIKKRASSGIVLVVSLLFIGGYFVILLILSSATEDLFVRVQKNCPIIWQKARIVMTESDSFNNERSGKLPTAQISRGMPVKASTDCLRKLLLIYVLIFNPMTP